MTETTFLRLRLRPIVSRLLLEQKPAHYTQSSQHYLPWLLIIAALSNARSTRAMSYERTFLDTVYFRFPVSVSRLPRSRCQTQNGSGLNFFKALTPMFTILWTDRQARARRVIFSRKSRLTAYLLLSNLDQKEISTPSFEQQRFTCNDKPTK
jgi:hypothetical protein